MAGGWLLPVVWTTLAVVIVASAAQARRSRGAYLTGILGVSVLWVLAGALVNAWFLMTGDDYSGFADGAATAFVRDTWESLVVPHHTLFIGLLIAFEAVAGLLVLIPGRVRRAALSLLVVFNLALVSFGWGFLLWSVPITLALLALIRAGTRWDRPPEPAPHAPVRSAAGAHGRKA